MRIAAGIAVSALVLGCGASPDEATQDSSEEALAARALSPFTLQAAGLYEGASTRANAVRSIDLHPDGSYAAIWNSGFRQTGHFSGGTAQTNPLPLTMRSGSHAWSAQVNVVSGQLTTGASTLQVNGGVMSESACDGTAGIWSDDETDPVTGLFCACPAHKVLIWSAGGCVTRHAKTP